MNKTIYLNYNLDDPKELACYNALIELGQSRRSVINLLMLRAGLVDLNNTVTILQPKKRKKKDVEEKKSEQVEQEVNQPEQHIIYETPVQTQEPVQVKAFVQQPVTPMYQQQIQQQSVMQQIVTKQQEPNRQNADNDISDEEATMISQLGNIFLSMQS